MDKTFKMAETIKENIFFTQEISVRIMKIQTLITRSFCFLVSAGILCGLYVLFLGSKQNCDWLSPTLENPEKEIQDFLNSDPFLQTARFSDAEVSETIALYESGLAGVSARLGNSVLVQNSSESLDSDAPSIPHDSSFSSATPIMLGAPMGQTAENSGLILPPQKSNPLEADIWQIETSWASHTHPSGDQLRKVIFYRKNGNQWEKSDAKTFLNTQGSSQPVIFYVHGNRTEANTAMIQGMMVLKNYKTEIPARLVIWTWDADRVSARPRIEYATKANYADFQGFYLANLLGQMNENAPVMLVGHSFGTRVVLSALHLLGHGIVGKQTLESAFPEEPREVSFDLQKKPEQKTEEGPKKLPRLNALLVAAAISCNAMVPGSIYDHALDVVSEMYITQNGADPALKFYPLMNGPRFRLPEAMGYAGPVLTRVKKEDEAKVHVIRLEYQSHQFLEYISMRCVQNGLQLN